jgi:hypothetical protein
MKIESAVGLAKNGKSESVGTRSEPAAPRGSASAAVPANAVRNDRRDGPFVVRVIWISRRSGAAGCRTEF